MTTVTWTASAPVTSTGAAFFPGQELLVKIGRTFGTLFRLMASSDSNYLGLDLNGNPMWIKR